MKVSSHCIITHKADTDSVLNRKWDMAKRRKGRNTELIRGR